MKNVRWLSFIALAALSAWCLCSYNVGIITAASIPATPMTIEKIVRLWENGELSRDSKDSIVFVGSPWSAHESERFGLYIVVGPSELTFTDYIVCGFDEGEIPTLSFGEKEQKLVIRGYLSQREAPNGGLFYLENCKVVEVTGTKTEPQKTLLSRILGK